MKALFAALLVSVLAHGAPASAASPQKSPLVGRWALDVSRMPVPPEARPKGVTIAFKDAGAGKWTTQVEIVDAGGGKSHAESTVPTDGTPTPVTGSLEADTAAAKMPQPGVLVMQLGKGSQPASTRIYSVSADGKTMTEIAAYFGQDGKPILRTNYFTRAK